MMRRIAIFTALAAGAMLLAGCPGMPGMPGAAGGSDQRTPPGVLPPPGLESGGARTLMGTTITPPDDSFLLFSYQSAAAPEGAEWQVCRRIIPLESGIIVEGVNFDGRAEGAEKDANLLIPFQGITTFQWKYEPKPAPVAETPASETNPAAGQAPK